MSNLIALQHLDIEKAKSLLSRVERFNEHGRLGNARHQEQAVHLIGQRVTQMEGTLRSLIRAAERDLRVQQDLVQRSRGGEPCPYAPRGVS